MYIVPPVNQVVYIIIRTETNNFNEQNNLESQGKASQFLF